MILDVNTYLQSFVGQYVRVFTYINPISAKIYQWIDETQIPIEISATDSNLTNESTKIEYIDTYQDIYLANVLQINFDNGVEYEGDLFDNIITYPTKEESIKAIKN